MLVLDFENIISKSIKAGTFSVNETKEDPPLGKH